MDVFKAYETTASEKFLVNDLNARYTFGESPPFNLRSMIEDVHPPLDRYQSVGYYSFLKLKSLSEMEKSMDQESQQVKQPRGARRRARTRANLLVAARKVFATRGYHDATITEITETAAVGLGTFYLHFRDKEAIFNTVLAEGLEAIRQQVGEEIAHEDNPSLPVVVRAIFHQVYAQRDIIRIERTGEGVAARSSGPGMLVEGFTRFLEQAADLSPFSEEEIPLLAALLEGLMDRAFHCWWDEQDEPGPDLMADRVLHVMKYGFPASLFEKPQKPIFTTSAF